ncbi:hypothetical protein ABG067_006776 [Albugo candida]
MKRLHCSLAVRLLVIACLRWPACDASECTSITQNVLTSENCPANCLNNPCVLYAPSLRTRLPCRNTGASGSCLVDSSYTSDSGPCEITYQCLDSMVNAQDSWFLSTGYIKQSDTMTQAYVTVIENLRFDPSIVSVQLNGGPTIGTKGVMQNIQLEPSFFSNQPSTVLQFIGMHINLRAFLDQSNVNFPPTLTHLYLVNVNLQALPKQIANCSLTYLDISQNYLTSFPSETSSLYRSLQSLTTLNLAENNIANLSSPLPSKLENLTLSGNPMEFIPPVVFLSNALKELRMKACQLSNVKLTSEQFAFLESLSTFDADMAFSGHCARGYGATASRNGKVCVFGAADTTSTSSSTGLIVGLVLGAVGIVLVACSYVYWRRKSRQEKYSTKGNSRFDTDLTEDMLRDGSGGVSGETHGSSSIWNDSDLLAVRVDYKDVRLVKLLSRGGFGEVWLGSYMNEEVAVKRLLSDKKTMSDALAFASEVKVMAKLEHPKIVRFIGVAWSTALTIQAVTEYMDCGDLKSLLNSRKGSSLTWANLKCQIAIDIADALVYMHTMNPKIIHRDLKSRNVLVDAQQGAKLSDFGISRNRSLEDTMTAGVGTARWIAPEVILGGHYTELADVYSLGVVLTELDTCKNPFHDAVNTNGSKMQDVTILQLVSSGQLKPSFSPSCPSSIVKLAEACLAFHPSERPGAIHVSYELRKILREEL